MRVVDGTSGIPTSGFFSAVTALEKFGGGVSGRCCFNSYM